MHKKTLCNIDKNTEIKNKKIQQPPHFKIVIFWLNISYFFLYQCYEYYNIMIVIFLKHLNFIFSAIFCYFH